MCANVYTQQGKFAKVISMTSRKNARKSLLEFTDDVGIHDTLITDGTTSSLVRTLTLSRRHSICAFLYSHTSKQGHKNQNHAAE